MKVLSFSFGELIFFFVTANVKYYFRSCGFILRSRLREISAKECDLGFRSVVYFQSWFWKTQRWRKLIFVYTCDGVLVILTPGKRAANIDFVVHATVGWRVGQSAKYHKGWKYVLSADRSKNMPATVRYFSVLAIWSTVEIFKLRSRVTSRLRQCPLMRSTDIRWRTSVSMKTQEL